MRLREMVLCGLFIALVAVGALIRIPVGSDVYTLQFMFTLLAGLLLGGRLGALAVGTYVLMGLVGSRCLRPGEGLPMCSSPLSATWWALRSRPGSAGKWPGRERGK